MSVETILNAITFLLSDAAVITRTPLKRVEVWLREGRFTPAVRGRVGKYCGHRISAQQLYALSVVAALNKAGKKPSTEYSRGVFQMFEAMSDAALEEFRGGANNGGQVDEVSEEAIQDYVSKTEAANPGIFDSNGIPMTPMDIRCVADMKAGVS